MRKFSFLLFVLSFVLIWRIFSLTTDEVTAASLTPTTLLAQSAELPNPPKKQKRPAAKATATPKTFTRNEFTALLSDTLEKLPTEESVANREEHESHHGDPGIAEAAEPLGKIVEQMKADANLIPDGLEFFHTCARRDGVIPAIRALCLRDLMDWNERTPNRREIREEDYPARILFIAKQLPQG